MYKYILLFSLFFISCEKNTHVNSLGQLDLQFCDAKELVDSVFSVLSFNRLQGTSFNSVRDVIQKTDPDIIALQESYDIGVKIADYFNYCFIGDNEYSVAVLSKYPVEIINNMQYKIMLNNIDYIHFFNIHLSPHPYQPYDIRDNLITTPQQAIHQSEQARGLDVTHLISLIDAINDDMPIIVAGDFNEPSHLDWITHAENPSRFQNNQLGNFVVDWPASNKMINMGLVDAYREFFYNPISKPGYTWTPNYGVDEVHDRIDFIYYKNNMNLESILLVGPDDMSDIILYDYESDHRAVLAKFQLSILTQSCQFCGSNTCCSAINTTSCCCYPN